MWENSPDFFIERSALVNKNNKDISEDNQSLNFYKKGKIPYKWVICLSLVVLVLSIIVSITNGGIRIPFIEVKESIYNFDKTNTNHLIVRDLRIPRVIAGALVGAAFAVAGGMMQGMTRNPMADSGLLGLNAGAGFALAICLAFFPEASYMQIIMFSFLGAGLGTFLVNFIASFKSGKNSAMKMVLVGAAVSAFLSALGQGIALYFDIQRNIMFWTAGGVAGSTWEQIRLISPWIIGALVGSFIMAKSVSILSLGEDVAMGLGLNTRMVNILCSLIVLILAGGSVAVVGAVGFIGLVIPHIARYLVGVDYRRVLPTCSLLGAILMVLADLGARTISPPFEMPVGVLTALIGVPFFLYLARSKGSEL